MSVGFYSVSADPALPALSILSANGALVGPAPSIAYNSAGAPAVGNTFTVGALAGAASFGYGAVGGAGACASLQSVAAPLVGDQAYAPCWYFRERISPPLYMLAADDCAAGRVCCETGKIYRSFATINSLGANAFLQKGIASIGKGCAQTFALAPVVAKTCPCISPFN